MNDDRKKDLLDFLAGQISADELTRRHGMDRELVETLARAHGWRPPGGSRRRRWTVGSVVLVVLVASTVASGQALVTFSPDEPARAADVNNNFNALRTWIEQKVGPVGTGTITTSSLVLGSPGAQTTLTANSLGQLSLSGGLAMPDSTAGISSPRLSVAASVVNSNTATFAPGFLEGTFADPGGTIVIMASATGYCTTVGRITMQVRVDDATVASMRVFCNIPNAHVAFPATFVRLNRSFLSTPPGPSVIRTVRLQPINCASGCATGLVTTFADANDFGEITVLRLPTP